MLKNYIAAKLRKEINNYKNVDKYLENDCAVDCKHYILKKLKSE